MQTERKRDRQEVRNAGLKAGAGRLTDRQRGREA